MKRLFYLIVLFSITGYSQKASPVKVKAGIYNGGACLESNPLYCGSYILKDDSTFVFLRDDKEIIKGIGKGKWNVSVLSYLDEDSISRVDTVIQFKFMPNTDLRLLDGSVDLFGKTKGSFDSIYVEGVLKTIDNKPIQTASVNFISGYGTTTDKQGFFKMHVHRSQASSTLEVVKLVEKQLYPVTINLPSNYNDFRLNWSVPYLDKNALIPIDSADISVKYSEKKKGLGQGTLTPSNNSIESIFKLIDKAELRQRQFKNYFDWLRKEISN